MFLIGCIIELCLIDSSKVVILIKYIYYIAQCYGSSEIGLKNLNDGMLRSDFKELNPPLNLYTSLIMYSSNNDSIVSDRWNEAMQPELQIRGVLESVKLQKMR